MMLGILAAIVATQAASARADVESLADGGFRVTLVGYEADERASQAALGPIAAQLCSGGTPIFGRFEANRQLGTGTDGQRSPARFVQTITCAAASPVPSQPPRPAYQPDANTETAVRAAAIGFLNAYLTGDSAASWTMLTSTMRATQTRAEWDASSKTRAETTSTGLKISIAKLTWYTDPPGVDPGTYGAADFVGSSSWQSHICGYVVLLRQPDGGWAATRVESGTIQRSNDVTPEQLAEMKQAIRCVAE